MRTIIHGHPVYYEDEDQKAIEYFNRKIDDSEVEMIFHYAKSHGRADFETQGGKDYSLVHDRDKGAYEIVKR